MIGIFFLLLFSLSLSLSLSLSPLLGGIILAIIEGVGIAINRAVATQFQPGKNVCHPSQTALDTTQSFVALHVLGRQHHVAVPTYTCSQSVCTTTAYMYVYTSIAG